MNNMNIIVQCSFFVLLFDLISSNQDAVSYSSTFKLVNQQSGDRLHSHEVKYGSGSGQQSVTGSPDATDVNSYWQVHGENCQRGSPIKCDSIIRLLHVATRKNLHSHDFASPLSYNQEVSASDEGGIGDEGDMWKVICSNENDYWLRKDGIRLKHVATDKYLHLTGDTYGRPIHGQKEISCYPNANNQNLWKVDAGVYVRPSSEPQLSIPNNEFNAHSQSIYTDHVDYEL
ncbi:unnamed protein product [Rotaria socialis]|uniref:MIR domain-containing protein n=1 Tax=Rotaria socialis TaxID=392032 RepID=A0A820BFA1_9BILA|nr:unnamed protein product [Rotaria socialis]CAF3649796.1 unnamed protein product [Rotaria socialis]CAF4200464.1 unnamed protein product [Rotaria socialis]CAF4598501.1 unnamed protein product [Rotaria socialis]